MSVLLPLATEAASGHLQLLSNIRYQTVGMMIVMTSLCGLAVLVAVVAKGITAIPQSKKPADPAPVTPPAVLTGGVSPEIQAVIAAAVHVALKTPHRILHVEPVRNLQLNAWSIEGRRQIFQSHTFR